jgi:hypothetical protein
VATTFEVLGPKLSALGSIRSTPESLGLLLKVILPVSELVKVAVVPLGIVEVFDDIILFLLRKDKNIESISCFVYDIFFDSE